MSWPDEMLSDSPILRPEDMLRRLTWQLDWYSRAMETRGLAFHAKILIAEKWDRTAKEYRMWFELTEMEREWKQREKLFIEILSRLNTLEAQRGGGGGKWREHHDT
jgi:hypothetical protein